MSAGDGLLGEMHRMMIAFRFSLACRLMIVWTAETHQPVKIPSNHSDRGGCLHIKPNLRRSSVVPILSTWIFQRAALIVEHAKCVERT